MAETRRALDSAEVLTLKHLALVGALDGERKLSCASLADRLDASTQTASRRLQRLEEEGFIDRDVVSDGQWITITDDGRRRLRTEYETYRRIFEVDEELTLAGTVTSGMGEGRHYITLSGYMRQFREKLGYEPFPGTLNVDLTEESIRTRTRLDALDPIVIDGWESDDRTYGPAYCYPATLTVGDEQYAETHVITPERTHHGDDHLELIAPEKLRDTLPAEDGTEVSIRVTEQ
ncbi:CTP-dependent riboflavin kinase [Halovenus salina]|uniref:Riboflavin kinase n=1 Tax=Halovenus salina TaxID=1510225 RepID=A0ABD5W6A7_9EURY|nr:CTP-dependent riboflavin kinase [Halovenus salina]